MKTAIFLSNGCLGKTTNSTKLQVVIFTLDNDKVSGVENEIFLNKNIDCLVLWCLSNGINQIYKKSICPDHRKIFHKLDINIKTEDELKNDYLYNTFILGDKYIHP